MIASGAPLRQITVGLPAAAAVTIDDNLALALVRFDFRILGPMPCVVTRLFYVRRLAPANAATTPRSVRTSCSVSPARANIARRFITMFGTLAGG